MPAPSHHPSLTWDAATGYDFFISLHVLHAPDLFGLRGAWAKGVRARLPAGPRALLEEISPMLLSALPWVYHLDPPKTARSVMTALEALPPEDRFTALMNTAEIPAEILRLLNEIAARGTWSVQDRAAIREAAPEYATKGKDLDKVLSMWAHIEEIGEKILAALAAYHDVFFEEEEERIFPALKQAVARGKEMARDLPFPDLLAELSEGIRFEEEELRFERWIMIPSFWIAPRILISRINPGTGFFVHGGRPAEASLVPGEAVPDALYLTLKALADPTRLRILHYLVEGPATPSELAKKLRLRPPTVVHHLNSLRLAGLVYVTFGKGDKRYAPRTNRIAEMYLQLRGYLGIRELKHIEELTGRPPYVA